MQNVNGLGYVVKMEATHKSHFGDPVRAERSTKDDLPGTFGNMLTKALEEVNAKDVQKDHLKVQYGLNPDMVDEGELMQSIAEAELALNLTKAISDKAIRAYQELITMR